MPQGGCPCSAREGLLTFAAQLWAPGKPGGVPPRPHGHARGGGVEGGGTGRAGGKPGLKLGRSQEQEKAERGVFPGRPTWEPPLIPGLQGRKR